jgi:type IV pilus assembly protein PilQ
MSITKAVQPSVHRTRKGMVPQWRIALVTLAAVLLVPWQVAAQQGATLDDINFAQLPGNRVQVQLTLSQPMGDEPLSFAIDNPARIALDFPGVKLNLDRRTANIGVGMARSVTAVEASGRTRVVLNLIKLVPYEVATSGNRIAITLDSAGEAATVGLTSQDRPAGRAARAGIENVDFRRGEAGEGRVIVTLTDPSVVVDTREEGGRIVIDFIGAALPEHLAQRLDVPLAGAQRAHGRGHFRNLRDARVPVR